MVPQNTYQQNSKKLQVKNLMMYGILNLDGSLFKSLYASQYCKARECIFNFTRNIQAYQILKLGILNLKVHVALSLDRLRYVEWEGS
jgi:hypothetical protein